MAALLAALCLAACQPLPRPFAGATASPLLAPPDPSGVVVLPIDGVPAKDGETLAKLLVVRLQARDIVAGTGGGNRATRFLQGGLTFQKSRVEAPPLTATWDLFAPDGALIATRAVELALPAIEWHRDREAGLRRVAVQSLPALTDLLTPQDSGPRHPPMRVRVGKNTPGDGAHALHRAMESALRRSGLIVVAEAQPDALIIDGEVTTALAGVGRETAIIVWSVLKPDGRQIGALRQANTVPAGRLNDPWGPLAVDVADAAVGGLLSLLDQYEKRQAAGTAPKRQ